jgi:tetratricopeptide (TPR) repeat protein
MKRFFVISMALISAQVIFFSVGAAQILPAPALLRQIETAHRALETAWSDSSRPVVDRADMAMRLGRFDEVARLSATLRQTNQDKADALMAEIYLRKYDFKAAEKLIQQGLAKNARSEDFLWLDFRLLSIQENLPALDSLSWQLLKERPNFLPALLARGTLHYRMLNYDSARVYYALAEQKASDAFWKSQAAIGLSEVEYEKGNDQRALDTLLFVLDAQTISDRLLFAMCRPLIRLGRVQEAALVLEKTLELNPYSELAHYYLGNGFARFNYTQIQEQYPKVLADDNGQRTLAEVKRLLQSGDMNMAERMLRRIFDEHTDWVEPLVISGSMAWSRADFERARQFFERALELCPYWGRAHNGYAKAMEGKRMRENVHRQGDWQAFDATPMPEIPRIGEFVVDWNSLAPRHQKQVALAIAPWKIFVPVFIESGGTYYIKPLYERLSESPGLETMKDLRISYDSRLWDDVRGCGGFNTVTGIEDVERSIYHGYNTVLHELTHQVHGILTPDEQNLIQETYRKVKEREDSGTKTFMSDYQGTSVWEYFAEGVNAYWSPRRDKYDTREVVRERLFAMDTALVGLVEHFMAVENNEPYYVIGLVGAAWDRLEKANATEALALAQKAYAHDSASLSVLEILSHVHSILGQHDSAAAYADTLRTRYPDRSSSYIHFADAQYHRTGDKKKTCRYLTEGLSRVIPEEIYLLHLALGGAYWLAGNYDEAASYYGKVLDYQSDNSDALWGRGIALGDAGKIEEAKRYFEQAIEERTGIVELRLDYARILLQSGDTLAAGRQLAEAKLLDAEGDDVLAVSGWMDLEAGRPAQALEQFDKALAKAPYNDLAKILKLKALKALNRNVQANALAKTLHTSSRTDKPQWIYYPRTANYITVHDWPEWQVHLLRTVSK